ncbi:MAG: hypothetical protein DRG59_13795, partial [Deltaproteobacteria bacterium]
MGKIYEHIVNLVTKQIQDHGIVVWYDPEEAYVDFVKGLDIPDTRVISFSGSFFGLRAQIEPFLEFVDENGRLRPDCDVPPKLLIYVPMSRSDSCRALIEVESAGVVMEPGASSPQRNTRLKVLAERVFRKIAPDSVDEIRNQIEKQVTSLKELDKLSEEVHISSGSIKIIFGTSDPVEVVVSFIGSSKYDQKIEQKMALTELAKLVKNELGIDLSQTNDLNKAKEILERSLFVTELLSEIPEEERPEELSFISIPKREDQIEKVRKICKEWRNRLDFQTCYIHAARRVEKELGLMELSFSPKILRNLQSFPFIEIKLLQRAEELILEGRSDEALGLACERENSFWSIQEPTYRLHWKLVENSAQAVLIGEKIKTDVRLAQNDPANMVKFYTQGKSPWCNLDTYCRHLESQYASFDLDLGDRHDALVQVITRVRQTYTEVLEELIERFLEALIHSNFRINGHLEQREIFQQHVLPNIVSEKKTAYILVDALRFEMGKELSEGLADEFNINFMPAIAELPAITTVGMAALSPGAEEGLELTRATGGKLGVRIDKRILYTRASRIKHLKESIEIEPYVCKLNDLIKPSKRRQSQIKKSNFVLVTSQEID